MSEKEEEKESKYSPKSVVTTPVAIIIAGVIIAASVIATNAGLFGPKAPKTAESTGYKLQEYVNIAKEVGIKEKDFKACLDTYDKSEIEKDLQDGQAIGVQGTPSFFIGRSSADGKIKGVWLAGAYPFEFFQSTIDGILQNDDQKILTKLGEADPSQPVPTSIDAISREVSVDDDPILGDANAPLTIVEFSDYECPFCQRAFTQTYPSIKSNYIDSGQVKLVFRDFPLTNIHPKAMDMAVAANCAKSLGGDSKYFEYHDKLFSIVRQ